MISLPDLGLELTDPGFHFSVLAEFRARLVAGQAEHRLLDTMLERFKARGLVKAHGKQRTDSTHVLGAVRDLHLLELVGETLRATLDDLAAVVPDWVRALAPPVWFERYAHRVEDCRLPKSQEKREALALEIGADGFLLLDALDAPTAPTAARDVPWCGRCAMSGGSTTRVTTGSRVGGPVRNCPRSVTGCNRPMTRRCTTAPRGNSSGQDTRCISPRRVTMTRRM